MAVWVREDEKASENRQRRREAEEADKVVVAPGANSGTLGRFRAGLIDRLSVTPEAVSAGPIGKLGNPESTVGVVHVLPLGANAR